jgi:hypothetical protein
MNKKVLNAHLQRDWSLSLRLASLVDQSKVLYVLHTYPLKELLSINFLVKTFYFFIFLLQVALHILYILQSLL